MDDFIELPVTLKIVNSEINVVSFKLTRGYFKEPFFIDSLVRKFNISEAQVKLPGEDELLSRPLYFDEANNDVVYTPVKDFITRHKESFQYSKLETRLGFIFHMSRCGSTLFTQMLGASDDFFILSEPTIINAILDPAINIDSDTKKSLLRTCLGAIDSCAPLASKKTIIKFRSWNILFVDLILSCCKNVPWLFIHRNGIEVLASVMDKPPGWLRSKKLYSSYFSDILNIDSSLIINMPLSEFCSRLLGAFCVNARKYQSNQTMFLDYRNIKIVFFDIIKVLWKIELSEEERVKVLEVSDLYSKDAKQKRIFVSDSDIKQKQITAEQKAMVQDLVENERIKLI